MAKHKVKHNIEILDEDELLDVLGGATLAQVKDYNSMGCSTGCGSVTRKRFSVNLFWHILGKIGRDF